ncbi:MAG: hypothetical protein AAGB03_04185, partial [Pseudomonadota bacterium]
MTEHTKSGVALTQAEQMLAGRMTRRGESEPAWALSLQEAARERLLAEGLPHRRVEEWKYTDLRSRVRTLSDTQPAPIALPPVLEDWPGPRAVFVDGVFDRDLSRRLEATRVKTLRLAMADDPALVEATLKALPQSKGWIGELNAGLFTDGLIIDSAEAALEGRLLVVHVSTGAEDGGHTLSLVRERHIGRCDSKGIAGAHPNKRQGVPAILCPGGDMHHQEPALQGRLGTVDDQPIGKQPG